MTGQTVFTQHVSPELEAACDALAWAALAIAGQRIILTPACRRPHRMAARANLAKVHTVHPINREDVDLWHLLDGVWDPVPAIAERYGADTFLLTAALDEYARGLIAARMPHSFEEVQRMLRRISWAGTTPEPAAAHG